MTEKEWLSNTNPWPMLQFLFGKISRRKLVLFLTACCRRFGNLPDSYRFGKFPDRAQMLFNQAEEFADEAFTPERFREELATFLKHDPFYRKGEATVSAELLQTVVPWPLMPAAEDIKPTWQRRLSKALQEVQNQRSRTAKGSSRTFGAFGDAKQLERTQQATILRHIVGNPFQKPPEVAPECLTWNGGAVVTLARAIYQERTWERLPILADALEEAGCTDTTLLRHGRQPGEHLRGCWLLDLLMGQT